MRPNSCEMLIVTVFFLYDIVKIVQNAEDGLGVPRGLETLFSELYGHAALLAPDRAAVRLFTSYLCPPFHPPCPVPSRPVPSLRCLGSPRRAGTPPAAPARETNPAVKRPGADSTWARGWVSSSEDCSSQPLSSWHRRPQPEPRRSWVFFPSDCGLWVSVGGAQA